MSTRRTDRLDGEVVVAHERALDAASLERFQAIYLESFPPTERAPFQDLVKEIESGRYHLLTVREGGALRGFALSMSLSGLDVHLLAYLAVERPYRNRELGGRLLQTLVDSLASQGDVSGLLIEVDPEEAEDGRDLRMAARRIGFYKRLGAHLVAGAPGYRVPNLAGAGSLAMQLMWLPIRNSEQRLEGRDTAKVRRGSARAGVRTSGDGPSGADRTPEPRPLGVRRIGESRNLGTHHSFRRRLRTPCSFGATIGGAFPDSQTGKRL